jgi:hypothetical protein
MILWEQHSSNNQSFSQIGEKTLLSSRKEPIGSKIFRTNKYKTMKWTICLNWEILQLTGRPYYPSFRMKKGFRLQKMIEI